MISENQRRQIEARLEQQWKDILDSLRLHLGPGTFLAYKDEKNSWEWVIDRGRVVNFCAPSLVDPPRINCFNFLRSGPDDLILHPSIASADAAAEWAGKRTTWLP